MTDFARALPALREQAARDLRKRGFQRERVLACAVRLLDRGFFRIGGEEYAEENRSYGLATMRKSHVTLEDGCAITFDYQAKSGQAAPPLRRRPQRLPRRRGAEETARRRARAPRLPGRRLLVRRQVRRHQRVHQGGDRRRLHGQGLPHLDRNRACRGGPRGLGAGGQVEGGAPAGHDPCDRRGGALPRQHARGGASVVHRPARLRPLRLGRDDRRRTPRAGRRRGARRARDPGRDRGGRPRPPRGREDLPRSSGSLRQRPEHRSPPPEHRRRRRRPRSGSRSRRRSPRRPAGRRAPRAARGAALVPASPSR